MGFALSRRPLHRRVRARGLQARVFRLHGSARNPTYEGGSTPPHIEKLCQLSGAGGPLCCSSNQRSRAGMPPSDGTMMVPSGRTVIMLSPGLKSRPLNHEHAPGARLACYRIGNACCRKGEAPSRGLQAAYLLAAVTGTTKHQCVAGDVRSSVLPFTVTVSVDSGDVFSRNTSTRSPGFIAGLSEAHSLPTNLRWGNRSASSAEANATRKKPDWVFELMIPRMIVLHSIGVETGCTMHPKDKLIPRKGFFFPGEPLPEKN